MKKCAALRLSLVAAVFLSLPAGPARAQTKAVPAPADLADLPGVSGLVLESPQEYQVFQRQTADEGLLRVSGRCGVKCDRLQVRIAGKDRKGRNYDSKWQDIKLDKATTGFNTKMTVPAGGWYTVSIRALRKKQVVAEQKVERVGMGEVFIGAGQSNSTNCGGLGSHSPADGRTVTTSGMVTAFDGQAWRIANDPQPGTHDAHIWQLGSFWPAFGDALAAKYKVPVGVAVTGHGGTAIEQWKKDGELFRWTLTRMQQLGQGGFRAVLWHQGEGDFDRSVKYYYDGLGAIISDFRQAAGWDMPWFVAIASHHPGKGPSPTVPAAQRLLCERKIALEGPDTDVMLGDLRDNGGTGVHFSKKGLKVHGEAWADKIGAYLDQVLKN